MQANYNMHEEREDALGPPGYPLAGPLPDPACRRSQDDTSGPLCEADTGLERSAGRAILLREEMVRTLLYGVYRHAAGSGVRAG